MVFVISSIRNDQKTKFNFSYAVCRYAVYHMSNIPPGESNHGSTVKLTAALICGASLFFFSFSWALIFWTLELTTRSANPSLIWNRWNPSPNSCWHLKKTVLYKVFTSIHLKWCSISPVNSIQSAEISQSFKNWRLDRHKSVIFRPVKKCLAWSWKID